MPNQRDLLKLQDELFVEIINKLDDLKKDFLKFDKQFRKDGKNMIGFTASGSSFNILLGSSKSITLKASELQTLIENFPTKLKKASSN